MMMMMTGDIFSGGHNAAGPLMMLDWLLKLINPAAVDLIAVLWFLTYLLFLAVIIEKSRKNTFNNEVKWPKKFSLLFF